MFQNQRESYFPVSELNQDFVLANLLKCSYFYTLLKTEIEPEYFSYPALRAIYSGLIKFYGKNGTVPGSIGSFLPDIEHFCYKFGTTIDDVKAKLEYLMLFDKADESIMLERVSQFIRHYKLDVTLSDTIYKYVNKKGSVINIESLSKELVKCVTIDFSKTDIFTLEDKEKLKEVRFELDKEGSSHIIKSTFNSVNLSSQYGGYLKGTLNLIVGAPGNGKTSLLINEGAYAAQQFNTVLHIFLGDMVAYDGFIRYLSCLTGVIQDEIANMDQETQFKLIDTVNQERNNVLSRIHVLGYAASQLTIDQLIESIYRLQVKNHTHYDAIIIDYADNLLMESDFMYEERGTIYNKLQLLGRNNDSVMFVASQPKIEYWDEEVIPLKGASESSKKQHIVDLIMSLGMAHKTQQTENVGTLFINKVRRGRAGALIPVKTDWLRCKIKEIDEDEYCMLTSEIPESRRKKKSFGGSR